MNRRRLVALLGGLYLSAAASGWLMGTSDLAEGTVTLIDVSQAIFAMWSSFAIVVLTYVLVGIEQGRDTVQLEVKRPQFKHEAGTGFVCVLFEISNSGGRDTAIADFWLEKDDNRMAALRIERRGGDEHNLLVRSGEIAALRAILPEIVLPRGEHTFRVEGVVPGATTTFKAAFPS